MTDLELFKAITRAVVGVAAEDKAISHAVATVRALFAENAPKARMDRASKDRLERSGKDRSE